MFHVACWIKVLISRTKILLTHACLMYSSSQCSTTCGLGAVWRSVACSSEREEDCASVKKPEPARRCNLRPCAIWKTGNWSKVKPRVQNKPKRLYPAMNRDALLSSVSWRLCDGCEASRSAVHGHSEQTSTEAFSLSGSFTQTTQRFALQHPALPAVEVLTLGRGTNTNVTSQKIVSSKISCPEQCYFSVVDILLLFQLLFWNSNVRRS